MTTFATTFKQEIIRLTRRELKKAITPLKSATSKARTAIATLKTQLAALKQQTVKPAEPTVPGVTDKERKKARFSGKLMECGVPGSS